MPIIELIVFEWNFMIFSAFSTRFVLQQADNEVANGVLIYNKVEIKYRKRKHKLFRSS